MFPSSKIDSMRELEKERHLAYVAFYLAKDGLLLTSAADTSYDPKHLYPSRFPTEINPVLIRKLIRPRKIWR